MNRRTTTMLGFTVFALSLAPLLSLVVAGCGSNSKPTSASGTITSAQATSFASDQSSTVTGMANTTDSSNVTSNFVSLSRGIRAAANAQGIPVDSRTVGNSNCQPTQTPASTTDADGDGIPATVSYSFNCNYSESATTVAITGTFGLTDQNDTAPGGVFPKAGLTATISNLNMALTAGGQSINTSTSGSYALTVTNGTHTGSTSMVTTVTGGQASGTLGFWIDVTNTPDDSSNIATSGSSSISGFFKNTISGANYVLAIASSNLTYGCSSRSSFFKSGDITLTDGSSNVIKISYSSCNATVTFNGTTIARKDVM